MDPSFTSASAGLEPTSASSRFQSQRTYGSFKRFIHRQLSLVGAVNSLQKYENGRGKLEEINKELEKCLGTVVAAMNASNNSEKMDIIRAALQNYCSRDCKEKDRYSHFITATNTALLLLANVQIGRSRPCPGENDDNFLLFMVHDRTPVKSFYNGVRHSRRPDVIATFRGHIRNLYGNTNDLLQAVRESPKSPLHWKEALLCVEKNFKKKKIGETMPITYSVDMLRERGTMSEMGLTNEQTKGSIEQPRPQRQSGIEGPGARKRLAEDNSIEFVSSPKKIKTVAGKAFSRPPSRTSSSQVADYAAEAMSNCFGRSHIVNLLVIDTTVNVWYFDHESPIEMTAFDFIDDLPYFFLFLFALQRFNLADWGYIPGIFNINGRQRIDISPFWNDASSPPKSSVSFFAESMYPHFGLSGRATAVVVGIVTVDGVERDVALKLAYQEKNRIREHIFVEEARRRLKEKRYDEVCEYLPEILGTQEYHEFDSGIVRKAVMAKPYHLQTAARIPYLFIMPKYMPITTLTTNWTEFLNAFFALIYCHAMLWDVGIEHGDISEANLMWDPKNQKPKLCDFDLSHFTGQERLIEFFNIGTWAFMVLELLIKVVMQGKAERFYRHDLESFFAVLIWILSRYRNGKLLSKPPLEEWNQPRYTECADKRKTTYAKLRPDVVSDGMPKDIWEPCVRAARSYDAQQDLATSFRKYMDINELTRETLSATEKKKSDYIQSNKYLGPVLSYTLFKVGDGPEFVKKLQKHLSYLPAESPL